ncbi:N-acetyltransferase [Thalassotalea sp. HSM 43]|uniref:GNAT family N-acetyltransferase n=1 Tax=Thalassotalea sp. HSM 43 TaxID=2552945 RepID=UPI00108116FA|nr:GNAT family N-acetyltransferase [Thalassotalea sp. HSM 43]QBY04975.1 N-acetyltransferase [Thalassotalea sp. HSM 43]
MLTIKDSARLSYRFIGLNDTKVLQELDSDPQVMKYINGGKANSMHTIESVFIPRLAKYRNADKGWGLWQVDEKQSGQFLGWVLIRPMYFFSEQPHWRDLEIGWRFKQSAWGKGFASEAAKQVMNALIAEGEVDYFSAIADAKNLASIGVMKKLGLDYQKTDQHPDVAGEQVVFYQLKVTTDKP